MAGVGTLYGPLLLLLGPVLIAIESFRLSRRRGRAALTLLLLPALWIVPLILFSGPVQVLRPTIFTPRGLTVTFAAIALAQAAVSFVTWKVGAAPVVFVVIALVASLPMTALAWLTLEDAAGGGAL